MKKTKLIALVIALMMAVSLFAVPAYAEGSVLKVDGSIEASDAAAGLYKTIQEAVNAASADATIIVAAGEYKEQVIINKGLKLVGDPLNPDNVIINGENRTVTTPGLIHNNAPAGATVEIKGFKLINAVDRGGYRFFIRNGKSNLKNIITNCHFVGSQKPDAEYLEHGLYSYGTSSELVFTDNTLVNIWCGVMLERHWGKSTVSGNTFTGLVNYRGYRSMGVHDFNYTTKDVAELHLYSENKFVGYNGAGIAIGNGYTGCTTKKYLDVQILNNVFRLTSSGPDSIDSWGVRLTNYGGEDEAGNGNITVRGNNFVVKGEAIKVVGKVTCIDEDNRVKIIKDK